MNIKEFLYLERMKRGLSQNELSKKANLSIRTVSRIENGHSAGPKAIRSILNAFGMDSLPDHYQNQDIR
jgi:transcriptional regulator with XRE-family HTH domain